MRDPATALDRFLTADPARSGIFCDFDGTLAGIVNDPAAARPVPGAVDALEALARSIAVVAIVSGRPIADLDAFFPAPSVRLIGIYGLEERIDGEKISFPLPSGVGDAIERAARSLETAARSIRGATVERKGVSVAMHVRNTDEPDRAYSRALELAAEIARAETLEVSRGRLVVELRPGLGGDKGDALARVAGEHELRSILALGDDVGDLAMFAKAREFETSVCVGVASNESPSELAAAVDFFVRTPHEAQQLLERVAQRSTR